MFSAFEVGRKRCDGQPIHFEYWSRISILPTENSTTWVCSLPHYLPVEQSDSSSALKHSDEELLWSKFCESWNLASKYSKCNSCFTRKAIHIKGRVLQINLLRICINWVRFAKIYFAKIHILGNFRHAKYSKWSCLPWTCYSLMGLFIGLSPRWTPLNLLFCSSPNIWLWKLIQNKHVWDGCSTVVQHVDVEIATGKTQKSLTNGFCCFSCFSTIYVSPVSRHIWTFGLMLDQVPSELSVAGVKRGMRS